MPIGDDDLEDVYFNPDDVSQVTIVATGAIFYGFFEYPEQLATFGPVNPMAAEVAGKPVLHYATESAAIARGVILEIQGQGRWEVRETSMDSGSDGKTSTAKLKRP